MSLSAEEATKFIHCDEIKKDNFSDEHSTLIAPSDKINGEFVCENVFGYGLNGSLLPKNWLDAENKTLAKKEDAKFTIDLLNLNADPLRAARTGAVSFLIENNDLIELSELQKTILIKEYSEPDAEGRFKENCQSILFFLKNYYP